MSEPKWTPGPWRVRTESVQRDGFAEIDSTHWWALAEVVIKRDDDGSPEARQAPHNAHLIAAAPDLYAALDAILGWQETDPTSLGALAASNHGRNVLAKARGETPC
jgi:hypothetical protein